MKVTAIKQQAKRADRYSVYVDEKYLFSLSEGQLIASGLHSGQELDAQAVEQFQVDSVEGKLFDRLLNVLSYRPRSEWELREYLRRNQTDAPMADRLIERLRQLGYVDDEAFARAWLESRGQSRASSHRKLRTELLAKRVSGAIIDQLFRELATELDERAALRQLVAKKQARYPDEMKFMRYLAGKGFSYEDIRAVLADNS
ncbi:hypothetical protein E6P97_02050 [Patescibacteria group bacterium]|nr:MAG: hypothetical protein E6P97_02050 [Patescibacteria group bacterium]